MLLGTARQGCADPPPQVRAAAAPLSAEVAVTLFLVGDAGEPAPGGEPVLQALSKQIKGTAGRTVVAILGDNIYPNGLPPAAAPDRAAMEVRLRAQLEAARVGGAEVLVLPGNHDWENGRKGGWEAVLRQQRFVDETYDERVRWLPRDGCPGPTIVDEGPFLRLIALDTQWFLHRGPRPYGPDSDCVAATAEEALDHLRAALKDSGGRHTVLLAHHPLRSAGRHGGFFPWQDHIFPLRHLRSWLWLPLPVVGSIYPLSRQLGISSQDQSSSGYERLVEGLIDAFGDHPPLLYAAGHEHNLEVLGGPSRPWVVVSGAGRFGETTRLGGRSDALYLSEEAGFARLEVLASGQVRLAIVTVDREARATTAFAIDLDPVAVPEPAAAR